MNYVEAMNEARAGRNVQRSGWEGAYVFFHNGEPFTLEHGVQSSFLPSSEELTAEDWQILAYREVYIFASGGADPDFIARFMTPVANTVVLEKMVEQAKLILLNVPQRNILAQGPGPDEEWPVEPPIIEDSDELVIEVYDGDVNDGEEEATLICELRCTRHDEALKNVPPITDPTGALIEELASYAWKLATVDL